MTDELESACTCGQVRDLLLKAMNGHETEPCPQHRPAQPEAGAPHALNSAALTDGINHRLTN